MDPSQVKIPPMKNLTVDNITENVIRINSLCEDERMKYILERLVTHLHDFARETRLSSDEWMTGLRFLTEVGQITTEVRQEYILLSDVLGLSILVDSIDHPKPPGSTEGTVLGPFHTHDAEEMSAGDSMSHDPKGEPLLVVCTLRDTEGRPVEGVKIDIWETDSSGHYDVQYAGREGPDGRCIMRSGSDGVFWFKAITPVPYPIPHDGPVGKLLKKLHRHPYRPSHMHFMFEKEGYDHLITWVFSLLSIWIDDLLIHTGLSTFVMILMRLRMLSSVLRIPLPLILGRSGRNCRRSTMSLKDMLCSLMTLCLFPMRRLASCALIIPRLRWISWVGRLRLLMGCLCRIWIRCR